MPDVTPKSQHQAHLPPPSGDSTKAEKYLSQLIKLINQNRLLVDHTNLAQFDPSAIEDHYRMELRQYHVEISHSKQPETGQDFYIMLFTNLQDIRDGCTERIILAYMHLTEEQFNRFKATADVQVEKRRKEEEEKRFLEMMAPVDEALQKVETAETLEEDLKEFSQAPTTKSEDKSVISGEDPTVEVTPLPEKPSSNIDQASLDQKGVTDLLNDFYDHYSPQPSNFSPEPSPAPQQTFTPTYSPPPSSDSTPSSPDLSSAPPLSSYPDTSSTNLSSSPYLSTPPAPPTAPFTAPITPESTQPSFTPPAPNSPFSQ